MCCAQALGNGVLGALHVGLSQKKNGKNLGSSKYRGDRASLIFVSVLTTSVLYPVPFSDFSRNMETDRSNVETGQVRRGFNLSVFNPNDKCGLCH